MDAPPTPPPMTTARALVLKSSLGACLRGGRGRMRRGPLRDHPVDKPDDDDRPEGELVNGDVAEKSRDGDFRESAERWVLTADHRVARPEEVDLHEDAPDEAEDVDDQPPLSELERSIFLRPPSQPSQEDRYVAQAVRHVDHAGRADGDQGCAGVVEEWQAGQHADGDAGPDRSVQPRVHAAERSRHWQFAVTRHAERQPDGRGLD